MFRINTYVSTAMDAIPCHFGIIFWTLLCMFSIILERTCAQSCGPRVSARLLAEIPCDMSKSSYCSAPGSAYPWSSVKRYINDNQGLVRRMYGDEKHSSVLLNEIDGFEPPLDMFRHAYEGFRTVYGRSARAHRPSRRQPRPQLFKDDDDPPPTRALPPTTTTTTEEPPATIFRVVTETSIKVGEATRAMRPPTTTTTEVSYEPASELENHQPTTTTTTESMQYTDTTTEPTTTTEETTTTTSTTTTTTETSVVEELPVALERVGLEKFEDDYEEFGVRRKVDPSVLQNSVDEKTVEKEEDEDLRRRPEEEEEELMAEEAREEDDPKAVEEESEEEEEVPKRAIKACPVKNEVIAPYWANNTRGETLALLNVHPFEQYVHFEKCAFENHQMLCRDGCRCEQQYRLHRLLAFDPKNECRGIFSDWFRFPSCCVCICYDLTPDIPLTRSRKGRM